MSFVSVRGARPGKNVQLTETEIRGLCLKSRELFLLQPVLLELEAPLKICGEWAGEGNGTPQDRGRGDSLTEGTLCRPVVAEGNIRSLSA